MTTSSTYVYLQRPDNGEWITVGRFTLERPDGPNPLCRGEFRYAPSYLDAGHQWVIDPVNLPFLDRQSYPAARYNGLTDVLRDITPDAWGKFILRKEHNLGANAHELDYLYLSGNTDRWGAITIGSTRTPSKSLLASPKIPKLQEMLEELQLMASRKAPRHPEIRTRLVKTLSSGGARPKVTVRDGHRFWLVKPTIESDVNNTALLEHVCMRMGREAGLDIALTDLYQDEVRTAVKVERFDRYQDRRFMVLSAATLLGTEYPATNNAAQGTNIRWSYSTLASVLRAIGCPDDDLRELFRRMIFNVLIGNDDDHPRNHAVVWREEEQRWRLSPGFDIVPNLVDEPTQLAMQLSQGRWDFSRDALMSSWAYFGFHSLASAEMSAEATMLNIFNASAGLEANGLSHEESGIIRQRIIRNILKLGFLNDAIQ